MSEQSIRHAIGPNAETPTYAKGPGFKTPKSNRASPTRFSIPTELVAPSRKGKKRARTVEDGLPEGSPPHNIPKLNHWKVRLECALGCHFWTQSRSKKAESLFAAWKKELCVDRRDPARWLQELKEMG